MTYSYISKSNPIATLPNGDYLYFYLNGLRYKIGGSLLATWQYTKPNSTQIREIREDIIHSSAELLVYSTGVWINNEYVTVLKTKE